VVIISDPGSGRTCCALCYNATSPRCTCICGGANHGIGRLGAIARTTAGAP
jgi:hypothetical protein